MFASERTLASLVTVGLQFTEHSVGRVAPLMLSLVIALYLLYRRRSEASQRWLAVYFLLLFVFNLGYMVGYSVPETWGGFGWHLACGISFAAAARLQFAYLFPGPRYPRERLTVLFVSLILSAGASVDYAARAGATFVLGFPLHAYGSSYASLWVPLTSLLCFLWAIVVSIRRAHRIVWEARTKGKGSLVARFRSEFSANPDLRAVFYLLGITVCELAINVVFLLGYARMIGNAALAGAMNLALLTIFSSYVLLNSTLPAAKSGLMHRLAGVALVLLLVALTVSGQGHVRIRREAMAAEAESRGERIMAGMEGPQPRGVLFIGGRPRVMNTPTEQRGPPDSAYDDGLFVFGRHEGGHYFASSALLQRSGSIVAFEYGMYRRELDRASSAAVVSLLLGGLAAILVLPLLFRFSLVLPLRVLLRELDREGTDLMKGGPDEITMLQSSFGRMRDLLREARERLPDYSRHLLAIESTAFSTTQRIEVGGRTLVYRSGALRRVVESVERARSFRHPVLISGETGTGKELMARLIHDEAAPDGRFVPVNCAALPETLWESEVFGHTRGAFTDARADRAGRIREAGAGSVFFDEIGEMPLPVQAKLLRLLQERQFVPVGSDRPLRAQCRFIFATNRNLEELAARGEFREDLLYRIRVLTVDLPPLRERPEDIPYLLDFLVSRFAEEHEVPLPSVEPALLQALMRYAWPGNVREMENAVVRAMAQAPGQQLELVHFADIAMRLKKEAGLPAARSGEPGGQVAFDEELRATARRLITRALERAAGNKTHAAQLLGLKRSTLRYRMRELGLDDP